MVFGEVRFETYLRQPISSQFDLCPGDSFLFNNLQEIVKMGAVTGDPDHQVRLFSQYD